MRVFALAAVLAGFTGPVLAEPVSKPAPVTGLAMPGEASEALVMALIFDRCLPYLRGERTEPFDGLAIGPLTPEDEADLFRPLTAGQFAAPILGPRYIGVWGDGGEGRRMCFLHWRLDADNTGDLDVDARFFVHRLDRRFAQAGLDGHDAPDDMRFSPLMTRSWFVADDPDGIRVLVMPGDSAGAVAEAALIIGAAPEPAPYDPLPGMIFPETLSDDTDAALREEYGILPRLIPLRPLWRALGAQ